MGSDSEGSRLAESERGVWFWLKRYSISTPHFYRKNELTLFRGRKTILPPNSGAQEHLQRELRQQRARRLECLLWRLGWRGLLPRLSLSLGDRGQFRDDECPRPGDQHRLHAQPQQPERHQDRPSSPEPASHSLRRALLMPRPGHSIAAVRELKSSLWARAGGKGP